LWDLAAGPGRLIARLSRGEGGGRRRGHDGGAGRGAPPAGPVGGGATGGGGVRGGTGRRGRTGERRGRDGRVGERRPAARAMQKGPMSSSAHRALRKAAGRSRGGWGSAARRPVSVRSAPGPAPGRSAPAPRP